MTRDSLAANPSRPTPKGALGACLLGVLASCGGGGGGGGAVADVTAPTLVTASILVGSGSPGPGDTLELVLDEPVQLTGDQTLTNASFQLSGSATLGTVTSTATITNGTVVQVTLGAGVSLDPGVTTLAFADGANLADLAGNPVATDPARTVGSGDAEVPEIDGMTLNNVVADLNGEGAAGGTLQVPSNGFSINLTFSDDSSDVDPTRTSIRASVPVLADGVTRTAGTDLSPWLTRTDNGSPPTGSDFAVPATVVFPSGSITISAQVQDTSGRVSTTRDFQLLSQGITDANRTFRVAVNPSQLWHIDLSRDLESFATNLTNPFTPIEVTQGANGRGDFEDLLEIIGLYSATPITNVAGSGADSNAFVLQLFRNALDAQLTGLWSGANITWTYTAPGAFPGGASFTNYNSLGFSAICIAGAADTVGTSGILGVALFDPGNNFQDNNCDDDFSGQRLGVFFHTIANEGFRSTPTSTFRQTFDPFTPVRGGTPIGDDPSDGDRLLGSLGDARASAIDLAISRLARFVAVILAHECGHSMGLVKNNASPAGLYGNLPGIFPGSNNGHIALSDTLYPGAALNIMSPVISLDAALSAGTDYNTLNRAYLREQVLIDD